MGFHIKHFEICVYCINISLKENRYKRLSIHNTICSREAVRIMAALNGTSRNDFNGDIDDNTRMESDISKQQKKCCDKTTKMIIKSIFIVISFMSMVSGQGSVSMAK